MSQRSITEEDENRRERRHELVSLVVHRGNELASPRARQHLMEGFNRRVLMIDASMMHLLETAGRKEKTPLTIYQATESAVQLNALCLNICGGLDNLAWALQYERAVLPNVTEATGQFRKVGLANQTFLDALKAKEPALADRLKTKVKWNRELRQLRDPAAHRIPLFVAPAIAGDKEHAEWTAIQAESAAAFRAGNFHEGMNLQHKAAQVGVYAPMMVLAPETGLEPRWIPPQLRYDDDHFAESAEAVLGTLFPTGKHHRGRLA